MFEALFLMAVIAGFSFIVSKDKVYKHFFILIIVLFPSSLQFGSVIYKNGLYWLDGATFGGMLALLLKFVLVRKTRIKKNISLILPMLIIIFVYFLAFLLSWNGDIESLKDLRPILYIIFLFVFREELEKYIASKYANIIVLGCISASVIYSLITYLEIFSISEGTNSGFRYLGIQTYFCLAAILIIILEAKFSTTKVILLILCFVTIFISESRMLLLTSLLPILLLVTKSKDRSKLFYFIPIIIVAVPILSFESMVIDRLKILFADGIGNALSHRIYPAITEINNFDSWDYLVGEGFGKLFYIDWFSYREGVYNYSVQVDSLYLTFYTKYGLFSIFIIASLAIYLSDLADKKLIKTCVFYILLISFISSSFIYHTPSIGLFIGLLILNKSMSSNYKKA